MNMTNISQTNTVQLCKYVRCEVSTAVYLMSQGRGSSGMTQLLN